MKKYESFGKSSEVMSYQEKSNESVEKKGEVEVLSKAGFSMEK